MTALRTIILSCDGPKCLALYGRNPTDRDPNMVRRKAEIYEEWTRRKEDGSIRDYCRECKVD